MLRRSKCRCCSILSLCLMIAAALPKLASTGVTLSRLPAQFATLITSGGAGHVSDKMPFPSLHKLLGPSVIKPSGNSLARQCCPRRAGHPARSGFCPRRKSAVASRGGCPSQSIWQASSYAWFSSIFWVFHHSGETRNLLNDQTQF